MAEYRQTLHEAVFRFPLRTAFALLPPRGERLGHEAKSAGHGDHAWLDKRAEVKAWIARHFQVVKQLPVTDG